MAYVGPGTSGKHFTTAEVAALHGQGIATVLLVEGTVGASGYDTGRSHAQQAVAMAAIRGFPTRVLYFAVDRDVSVTSWPGAREYLRGAASVVGVGAVGIYGERDAMVWAARDGVASWFFQTFAWSGGAWYPGNHVEQYRNGVNLAGGEVDLCRSMKADFGQWPHDATGGDDDMTPEQAQQLAMVATYQPPLAWRVDALAAGSDTVRGGPYKGEPMWVVQALKAIDRKLSAIGTGDPDTAAILAGIDAEMAELQAALEAEVRDAVADLGEGGAAQVRTDA